MESYKNKYVNGKQQSGQIPVGYNIHLDNTTDYLLEESGNNFQITPMNSAGDTSAVCSLIQEESNERIDIHITTPSTKEIVNISIFIFKSPANRENGILKIRADQAVASNIVFSLIIQYGVSPNDQRTYTYTLYEGRTLSENVFAIQKEAEPQLLSYDYNPKSDSKYIYSVNV